MSDFEALFDDYKDAVFKKDVKAFADIFDENVRVFDMWHWSYNGIDEWEAMAKGWFDSLGNERVAVTFDAIQTHVIGDMASANAVVCFAAINESGEELRSLQNRLTWIGRKKGGLWKIVHEHTSGPVDHATMKVLTRH